MPFGQAPTDTVRPRRPQRAHSPAGARVALAAVEGQWQHLVPELGILLAREAGRRILAASREAERLHAGDPRAQARRARRLSQSARAIGVLRGRIYRHIVEPRIEHDRLRYAFTNLDLILTLAKGIINDDLLRRGWSA